uniref:Protein neuralized n=1 Tax=Photinus pyralis TaxID=7054 RepID=A0A1Y1LAX8_PHOPY
MGISENNRCNCQADKVKENEPFPSLKGKMKVLKKIKRRMGLVSRSSSHGGGTNNLPPLLFHNVHGDNIRISRDGTVARRVESFCKGIAFSSRPVKVNEKVCIKFLEISNNWSGVIRFGFTYNDPSTLRYGLPKYACPDLTNKSGYWAKALAERFCSQNTLLFYYVTSAGDVHFGINGEEKGIFFGGVETRGPLWALIDVYGNSTAVEFVDIRHQLNNNRRNLVLNSCDTTPEEIDRIVYPMQGLNIQRDEEMNVPPLRYQPPSLNFAPVSLHRTRGRNVRFNSNRNIAARIDTEFCQGYVFTPRPLQLGERIVIQVISTEPMFEGYLGLGLTSCDPANLQTSDLPDDSNFLLDRPEYWVISKDFARHLNRGDEISFCIAPNGEVQISKNGGNSSVVIHVDQTLRLWAFFDIYGSTQRIRVLSCPPSPVRNPERRIVQSDSVNGIAVLSVILPSNHTNVVSPQAVSGNAHHSSQNSVHSQNNNNNHASHCLVAPIPQSSSQQHAPIPTGTMLSGYSSTYIEPISANSVYSTLQARGDHERLGIGGAGTECTICYEHPIDSVLYMCGHMCMCYECALQQWRGKGGGHCPLCRAIIRDVIRTYKS